MPDPLAGPEFISSRLLVAGALWPDDGPSGIAAHAAAEHADTSE